MEHDFNIDVNFETPKVAVRGTVDEWRPEIGGTQVILTRNGKPVIV
jgi:hypothetical protein